MLEDPIKISEVLADTLKISCGVFWIIAYVLILRRGYLDKRYGMPMLALCANFSWEFIFSFIYPHSLPQLYIDYLWLAFDLGILIQYLQYGRRDFPANLPAGLFYPTFGLSLVLSALFILLLSQELNEYVGIYAAFGQNLLMSVLFIHLLLKRDSPAGQSMYIATSKLMGTVFSSILFYLYYPQSGLLLLLYISILFFDLVYGVLLYRKLREANLKPWVRL